MPRHFANLQKTNPKAYQEGSDKVWNSFVSITHAIGLSNFFSFTPDFLSGTPDFNPEAVGQALGHIYQYSVDPDYDPAQKPTE